MKYFISGHRDLTIEEFEEHYIPIIDKIITDDDSAEFLVGDWEGCDLMAVEYLSLLPSIASDITIYYVEKVKMRPFGDVVYDYKNIHFKEKSTYDECDSAMTLDSDFDVAWIREGKEDSHTTKNIKRRYENRIS